MTESAPAGTMLDSADAVAKVGSAGKSQFFVDVRVVRPDGTECGPDEIGEVVLSGPNIMAGYWNAPEETAAAIVDGWYHSGDAGSTDEDGYLYIRDRYKDMIISGGENVYPAEIESALLEFDDVQEVAVIGVPDPTWGEVGLAVVVPTPGTALDGEELRARLRARLAGFKVPKYVEFADELPKTATGKIRKPDLRDRYVTDRGDPRMSTTTTTSPNCPSLKGQELGTSDWVEVTQERVNLFADATGDHQWIHVDVDRAKAESPFGGPIGARLPDPVAAHPDVVGGAHGQRRDDGGELRPQQGPVPRPRAGRLQAPADRHAQGRRGGRRRPAGHRRRRDRGRGRRQAGLHRRAGLPRLRLRCLGPARRAGTTWGSRRSGHGSVIVETTFPRSEDAAARMCRLLGWTTRSAHHPERPARRGRPRRLHRAVREAR